MKKIVLLFLVAFVLAVGLSFCGGEKEAEDKKASQEEDTKDSTKQEEFEEDKKTPSDDDDNEENGNSHSSRWPACDAKAETQTITFVHINDLHATYNPESTGEGPASRIRGYFESVLAENPYSLFTNGGDDHEKGSVAELISEGYSTLEIVKGMKFDVRVIGNHDFAWNEEHLLDFSRDPHSIVLASNTKYIGNDPEGFGAKEFAVLEVGCVKIGFFGMVSKPWNEKNQQYDGNFFPNFETNFNYVQLTEEILKKYRSQVDIMVMVSHLGLGEDTRIAEETIGIDFILGGHSHSTLSKPKLVNETAIIQTGSNAAFVGRLDAHFDLKERKLKGHNYELKLNIRGQLPESEVMQKTVSDIIAKYAPDIFEPAAKVKEGRDKDIIGLRTAMAAAKVGGCDAAIVDRNSIWQRWKAGDMNKQDMLNAYKVERQPAGTPGFNAFYWTTIKGKHLSQLASLDSERWAVVFPDNIEKDKEYRLALQKMVVYNPAEFLPEGVEINGIEFISEAWEVLYKYGSERLKNGLYIDDDSSITD